MLCMNTEILISYIFTLVNIPLDFFFFSNIRKCKIHSEPSGHTKPGAGQGQAHGLYIVSPFWQHYSPGPCLAPKLSKKTEVLICPGGNKQCWEERQWGTKVHALVPLLASVLSMSITFSMDSTSLTSKQSVLLSESLLPLNFTDSSHTTKRKLSPWGQQHRKSNLQTSSQAPTEFEKAPFGSSVYLKNTGKMALSCQRESPDFSSYSTSLLHKGLDQGENLLNAPQQDG